MSEIDRPSPLSPIWYFHSGQFSRLELTPDDYKNLALAHLDDVIFKDSSEDMSLAEAIELSRRSLLALLDDRKKRRAAHEEMMRYLSVELPHTHAFVEQDDYGRVVAGMISQFCESLLSGNVTDDIGLELGHQEHVGDISEEKVQSLNHLYAVAEECLIDSAALIGGEFRRASRSAMVTTDTIDINRRDRSGGSVERIHKKMPEWDIVMPGRGTPSVEVYTRETYAGLSRCLQGPDVQALKGYLKQDSPREVVACGYESWITPISTSLIIRARL